ncbi:MAG TPA: transglutaminase family protein [Gemmataceae bacterium]|nr:transglutaminase family protein [Gemmataceae bacterium]
MLIRLGYDLTYQVPARTPMLLMLYVHPTRASSLLEADRVQVEPYSPVEEFTDAFGNRCGRVVVLPGTLRLRNTTLIEDSGAPDAVFPNAWQHPVEALPTEVLPFLLGSRYCEVDELTADAWSLFGQTPLGWPRVQAVCDWVHQNVQFGYQFASPTKTARDVYRERAGVCRDLNHLALTFCRCLGIPARYVTGYLGDIGVPASPAPMDFSGWFEAYLSGQWHTFDARHNTPRLGRVVMARGRDAVDVAFTTSFGPTSLVKFEVTTFEEPQPFRMVNAYQRWQQPAVS